MSQTSWVGALGAAAILATGISAWAMGPESAWPAEGGKAVSAPLGGAAVPAGKLLAGQDLRGVSAPPGRTYGDGDDASKASGPPGHAQQQFA